MDEKQLYERISEIFTQTGVEFMSGASFSYSVTDIEKLKLDIEVSYMLGRIGLVEYDFLLNIQKRLKMFWGLLHYR